MENFSQYSEDFSINLTGVNDDINLHLSTLFLELQDIFTSTYIFRAVDDEWDKRVCEKEIPDYSTVRTILYEALVYRIILGLSKIFANHKEYSLLKATNQIEQLYHHNKEARNTIGEIRKKIDTSPMIPKIRTFRDKFFAHLDKENVLLYFRYDPTSAVKYVDCNEIEEWLSLVGKLYKACFEVDLPRKTQMPTKEEIVHTFFGEVIVP